MTRAEVEETTFAMKRELSAIKQHDIDTNMKLGEAKERIRILSEQLEDQSSKSPSLEEVSLKSEIIKQKQEMIECLQEELIKVFRGWQSAVVNTDMILERLSVSIKLLCIHSYRPT